MPKLKEAFHDAPYIARPGGTMRTSFKPSQRKKQLIIASVVTEVSVALPTLSALAENFDVFVVTDASGIFNELTRNSAWGRMSTAGAQLMTWFGSLANCIVIGVMMLKD